jgi:hypothetical protein
MTFLHEATRDGCTIRSLLYMLNLEPAGTLRLVAPQSLSMHDSKFWHGWPAYLLGQVAMGDRQTVEERCAGIAGGGSGD